MRFLLDENTHHGLIPFLSGLGHEVTLSPKGLMNGDVLFMAITDNRVLVTHDSDFGEKIPPSKHPGIILVKIFPRHFDQIKNSMKNLITQKPSQDLYADRLFLMFEDRTDDSLFISEERKFDR